MKFTDKRTKTEALFGDIKVAECFITPTDGHINMRMAIRYYSADDDADNAVDLITGRQYFFEDDETVIAVNAEIIATD